MKAITISQPYASMIACGEKWVENRDWPYLPSYRGPLAIHAGKGTQYLDRGELRAYPTSCIVAVAELRTAIKLDEAQNHFRTYRVPSSWRRDGLSKAELEYFLRHEHTEGPVCLVLGNVRKLQEPVSCMGARGLWNVSEALEEMIMRAVG